MFPLNIAESRLSFGHCADLEDTVSDLQFMLCLMLLLESDTC